MNVDTSHVEGHRGGINNVYSGYLVKKFDIVEILGFRDVINVN